MGGGGVGGWLRGLRWASNHYAHQLAMGTGLGSPLPLAKTATVELELELGLELGLERNGNWV